MIGVIFSKCIYCLLLFTFTSCEKKIIELKLEKTKYGSLQNNEYDYYKLTMPKEIEKYYNLIIELEPNKELDIVSNIISNPNLYVSKSEKYPNEFNYTWSSKGFGDEIVSINSNLFEPKDNFYLGVHCKDKCNYIIKSKLIKNIPLLENKKNTYELNSNSVMKFSFRTRDKFNNLLINVVGSYINSFKVYLAKKDASSSNTLPSVPILYNGYQFLITNDKDKYSSYMFELIVDNEDEKQELSIWLKYDNDTIKINESEVVYESIQEKGVSCYNFPIENSNKEDEIILSIILFNGYGFIHINGFNQIDSSEINSDYKSKEGSYQIYQNKIIKLSKETLEKYGNNKSEENITLNFCFYAEVNTSLSIKVYYLRNYKKIQLSNIIYPGIGIEDIIPKNSVTKYKLEHFNVDNDLYIYLEPKQGKSRLFLYIANPSESNYGIDKYSFELLKKTNEMIEAKNFNYGYYLIYSKEANKCVKKNKSGNYKCYLYAIVECESNDDCIYLINFDHSKAEIKMKPKETYSDVISEGESDYYSIIINDPSVKDIAIVLTQNTGKTVLKLDFFNTNDDNIDIRKEIKNNEFLPSIIKLSSKDFKRENLIGIFSLRVKGLSFASYSLYYYTFNEKEKLDYLDYDNVSMKLEKGKIIKDIFVDDHFFKVYLYDSSSNLNKTNLYITLVETDYVDFELYVFKDLDDFTMNEGTIVGYLWKGEYRDYIYIDKNDTNYLENDILYIMIYKKTKKDDLNKNNGYSTFYLGVTDENTPFLLNEAIEFIHQLNYQHNSQKFLYNYLENEDDLQISFSIYYGHILLNIFLGDIFYGKRNITTDSQLIYIKKSEILKFCKEQKECPILIEVKNDEDYSSVSSSFLISIRNTKDVPINLKQGVVNKRTILSGEDQHFIIDLKPDKSFGAKITAFFSNGQGILYARKLLKNELYKTFVFPDENNYEYFTSYLKSNKGFYILEIPYEEISDLNPCKILLTVRGIFPGLLSTKIEYVLSVSNTLNEIVTDKNYKLFISKGEISFYHFKLYKNNKRLYISMTNKDQDANMYLSYDKYISNLYDYQWKNTGSYNEYLDLSIDDSYFVQRGMINLDGDYYLAIQGLEDTFFNLYICTENIKIITLNSEDPSGCSCDGDNDRCYFRYENINNLEAKTVLDQKLIFYTEYTYGRGELYGKLYPNGNMDEIINDLPSKSNHKYFSFNFDEFLLVKLSEGQTNYTLSSVLVLVNECKEKSLFDLSVVHLDKNTDLTRKDRNLIFIKLNQDNIFYLSKTIGISSQFIYYISEKENLNFQIKSLLGKADIQVYTKETEINYNFLDDKEEEMSKENCDHISDFSVDNYYDNKKNYFGKVLKKYGYKNFVLFEVKPVEDCLINIILNYDNEMSKIPLNKEVVGVVKKFNYYGYFDFLPETEEVIVTFTSLEKKANYNIFLKVNIIDRNFMNEKNQSYSMASSKNYDLKGTTNPLTSAVSFKIKNIPKDIQKESIITRILINVYSDIYDSDQRIKILVSPVMNNINRIRPEQKLYYFSGIENIKTDKTLFLLKNRNKENNLMIIEISSCKGNFEYTLTDFPPLGTESYTYLKQKEINSNIYSFNGKKVIVIRNCETKDYYLMIFGEKNKLDFFIDENDESHSPVDILFYYYTTKENNFNYLVTQDSMIYDIENNYKSIIVKLPELRNRDIFGKENNISDLNFSVIISTDKKDFDYMESTCYLTKLKQKREKNNEFNYLNVEINQENKIIKITGFNIGETYYINILAKNELTGEIITYRPIIMNAYTEIKALKIVVIIVLSILILIFLYIAFYLYRKYRLQKSKIEEQKEEKKTKDSIMKKFKNLSKLNLNIFKKKYRNLKEDKIELSDKGK